MRAIATKRTSLLKLIGRYQAQTTGAWTEAVGEAARIVQLDWRIEIGGEFVVVSNFYVDADEFHFFQGEAALSVAY